MLQLLTIQGRRGERGGRNDHRPLALLITMALGA